MPILQHIARQQMAAPALDSAYCAESNRHEILGISGSFFTLATIIVALRMLVRSTMIRSVGADDYVMLCAWLMSLGTFTCLVGETDYAVGRHTTCVSPPDFKMTYKWLYFHSLCVMIGVVLVKISVALFLMRLVPPGVKWKRFLWAIIIFLICFCVTCFWTLVFSCVPISATWNFALRANKSTRCFSSQTFAAIGLMNSSINCATDFLLAIVPIPIIVKLQVNRRTKISLSFILSLGFMACAAGIVKAIKQHGFFEQKDPFWKNDFNVWHMIELSMGIVAASLPALRPLLAKLLESTKTAIRSPYGSRSRTILGGSGPQYRRQRSREAGRAAPPGDVKLNDWKDVSNGTSDSRTVVEGERELRQHEMRHKPSKQLPRYNNMIRGTGGRERREPEDDSSWEDIEVVRSQSQESLNRPSGEKKMGITKTIEIERRSAAFEESDRMPRTMGMV